MTIRLGQIFCRPIGRRPRQRLWGRLWRSPPARPAVSPEGARLLDWAARGHVEAQLLLGQALLDGVHLARDAAQAVAWFTVAAQAGHPPAMNMLGRCLERGWGCAPDAAAAAGWYGRAAERGDDWARYNLANMRLRGRGVARDRRAAWALFLAAARAGHAKSMNLVGRFLEEGWDMPRDREAARLWYRRAAEAGDYRGQHNLASMLAEDGAIDGAVAWWHLALEAATPDILAAMRDSLARIGDAGPGHVGAAALRARVAERLAAAQPAAAEASPGLCPGPGRA